MFKWPPKEAQDFSRKIQERFKARTPKARQQHFLKLKDGLTSYQLSIPFSSKAKALAARKALELSDSIPAMEIISRPKLEEGDYIQL